MTPKVCLKERQLGLFLVEPFEKNRYGKQRYIGDGKRDGVHGHAETTQLVAAEHNHDENVGDETDENEYEIERQTRPDGHVDKNERIVARDGSVDRDVGTWIVREQSYILK